MKIDLKWMNHAHTLAGYGNFSRAATALGITQSALSRSILELENQVGIRLFQRTRAGVEPTEAGRLFLERSRDLLHQARDFESDMGLLSGRTDGELRIGAGTYPAEMYVAEAMARTLRTHPRVRMRVVVDHWASQLTMLRRREIDLAVAGIARDPHDPDLQVTPLGHRQGYFAVRAGHPLTRVKDLTLARILTFPLLSVAQLPPPLMEILLKAAREGGLSANELRLPAIGCDSLSMMHTIAAGSDAVALTDLTRVMPHVQAGRLAILPVLEPGIAGVFCIFRLAGQKPSPLSVAFERALKEAEEDTARIAAEYAKKLSAGRSRGG